MVGTSPTGYRWGQAPRATGDGDKPHGLQEMVGTSPTGYRRLRSERPECPSGYKDAGEQSGGLWYGPNAQNALGGIKMWVFFTHGGHA